MMFSKRLIVDHVRKVTCRKNFTKATAISHSYPSRHVHVGSWDLEEEAIFSGDHEQLRSSLRKIIANDINPFVDAWEEEKSFPAHTVFKLLGNAGYLGISKPTEYGGLGLDYTYSIAATEELGTIKCGAIPMAIGVQTDMATPALAKFGSHELKERFLQPSIKGDMVACLGVSETGAGSDVASIQTTAKADGDDLIINGGKMWTTNGAQADWMCCLANTNHGPVHSSKSLVCIPMDTPGVTVAKKINKIGMYSSDTTQIFIEDVRVPRSYIIGEEGKGFMYQMLQFQEERMYAAAAALKAMDVAIDETIEYTRNRMIFGKSVLDNQVVHYRLAELKTEVEALRSMLYRAVGLYVRGHDVTNLASMCKLKTGRLFRETADACLQYWGGMGFTNETLISRFYRRQQRIDLSGIPPLERKFSILKQMDLKSRKRDGGRERSANNAHSLLSHLVLGASYTTESSKLKLDSLVI